MTSFNENVSELLGRLFAPESLVDYPGKEVDQVAKRLAQVTPFTTGSTVSFLAQFLKFWSHTHPLYSRASASKVERHWTQWVSDGCPVPNGYPVCGYCGQLSDTLYVQSSVVEEW